MTVNEIMERAGTNQTGRAVAYIKDALDEINMLSETHITTQRMDINENQRFYLSLIHISEPTRPY